MDAPGAAVTLPPNGSNKRWQAYSHTNWKPEIKVCREDICNCKPRWNKNLKQYNVVNLP